MSLEQNKAIARRYIEDVWNTGNLKAADEIVADDFRFLGPVRSFEGLWPFKQYVAGIHATFPDIHFELGDVVAEENTVVLRWTMTGTHNEEFMGVPPSGKSFAIMGATVLRISRGKAVEAQLYWDRLTLLQQVGVSVPPV